MAEAESGALDDYVLDDAEDLRALRESIDGGRANRDQSSSAAGLSRDDESRVDVNSSQGALSSAEDESDSPLVSKSTGDGREAGDSNSATTGVQPGGQTPAFSDRLVLELARRGEALAGRDSSRSDFDESAAIVNTPAARAPAAPSSKSSWSMLSPAQVAYAQRYLESTETVLD